MIAVAVATVPVLAFPPPCRAAEPLAHVDGEPVTAEDLRAYRNRLAEPPGTSEGQELGRSVLLEEVINHRLLLKAARDRNLAEDPRVRQALQRSRRGILVESLLDRIVADRVTEERVRTFYRRHFGKADRVVQTRLVLRTSATRTQAERLAKGLPEDSPQGSWVFPPLRPPAFEKALDNAEKGEIVGPVATNGHWAVMRVTDRRRIAPPPLEETREAIRNRLESLAIREFLAELRDGARIRYSDSSGIERAPE